LPANILAPGIFSEILFQVIAFHSATLPHSPDKEFTLGGKRSSLNVCPVFLSYSSFAFAGLG
jgi:hypothetical protein